MILTDSIVHLFPEGAVRSAPRPDSRDPFADLDDLMCVIEALCPVWPARPVERPLGIYRL